MNHTDTADFTRTAAAMVAENDARQCAASLERLVELLNAA
jgi:hypothetical protein